MTTTSKAVTCAVRESPATLRELARAAGVPASTLSRIAKGEREATPAVAAAVAMALTQWSQDCAALAARIAETTSKERN